MRKLNLINVGLLMSMFSVAQETTDEKVEHLPENSNSFSYHGSPAYMIFNKLL
ncbi:MAG: hypothetical protein L3J83_08320 [Proteobacteria bacterium]|nr:hypothetical protein [Pseudomonadota bacterium]